MPVPGRIGGAQAQTLGESSAFRFAPPPVVQIPNTDATAEAPAALFESATQALRGDKPFSTQKPIPETPFDATDEVVPMARIFRPEAARSGLTQRLVLALMLLALIAAGVALLAGEGKLPALPALPSAAVTAVQPGPVAAPVAAAPAASPQAQAMPAASAPLAPELAALKAAAEAGDRAAQFLFGLRLADGNGLTRDEAAGAIWIRKAAEQGLAPAQFRAGALYERGRGVARDPAEARRWYEKAAQQGNRGAMHNLAVALADGAGGGKDFADAARWFRAAADLGLTDSQFNLALLYEKGMGVPQSPSDAFQWYAIAAAQGDADAKTRVAALEPQLDPGIVALAKEAAGAFQPKPMDPAANDNPSFAGPHARSGR